VSCSACAGVSLSVRSTRNGSACAPAISSASARNAVCVVAASSYAFLNCMDESELTGVVGQVAALVEAHYVFPDVAGAVSRVLAGGLAERRYPAEARPLAEAVTADMQSVNGDKHLRLLYHEQAQPRRTPGHRRHPPTSKRPPPRPATPPTSGLSRMWSRPAARRRPKPRPPLARPISLGTSSGNRPWLRAGPGREAQSVRRHQNPMASRRSRTVPRPGWGSALRMRRRLTALGCP